MRSIIVANWKLYITKAAQAERLLRATRMAAVRAKANARVVVCPPFIFMPLASAVLKKTDVALGAQNLFWSQSGPFTGELSAHTLKDYGVQYVIVGHSERRRFFDETDKIVAKKLRAALEGGLTPILCVGETARRGAWRAALRAQVAASTQGLPQKYVRRLLIAYEPVWAIGTGKADTPKEAQAAIREIQKMLARRFGKKAFDIPFLYGGSVTSKNVAEFLASPHISGALVGRASADPKDFSKIITTASHI